MLETQARDGQVRLTVKGTHGYRVAIAISADGALLTASKQHMAALYSTKDTFVQGRYFRAEFDKFGKVAVSFRRLHVVSSDCAKDGASWSGPLVGQIRFRGEEGFTQVDQNRVMGTFTEPSPRQGGSCKQAVRPSVPRYQANEAEGQRYALKAFTLGGPDYVRFAAGRGALNELRGWESNVGVPLGLSAIEGSEASFAAMSIKKGPGVKIVRLAAAGASGDAFSVGVDDVASVEPPSPFVGRGKMNICRLSSWRGNLKVSFPGKDVPLTSRDYWARVAPAPARCYLPSP